MYAEHYGEKIRQAREALGWTQEELARQANTTQAAVSYIERRARLRPVVLARYAAAMRVSIELLLGDAASTAEGERARTIRNAFEVICRDEDFSFGARGDERLSLETMLDIVRLYERYKGIHLLPNDFA
jgi:transcriptional regulator with XRE-family HTH domain